MSCRHAVLLVVVACSSLQCSRFSFSCAYHRVTSVTWDDGCFFCSEGDPECIQYGLNGSTLLSNDVLGCAQTNYTSTCIQGNSTDGNPCDLKVYVVWTGSDSKGNFFRSAGVCVCDPCAVGGSCRHSLLLLLALYMPAQFIRHCVGASLSSVLMWWPHPAHPVCAAPDCRPPV